MATKEHPLFPQVSTETYTLVQALCEAQGCTHSDVVEGALLAFLSPRKTSDRDTLLFQKLARLETTVARLAPLLEQIIAHLLAQVAPKKPTVASYEQLYPQLSEASDPEEDERPPAQDAPQDEPRSWRRFFGARLTP